MVSVSMIKNETNNETLVTISYDETTEDEYFVVEIYDEVSKMWVPYDGVYGIVEKE